MARVTREQVAKLAGVSKESVSYVFNRSRPVSDAIVAKVMKAADELGYVPDVAARIMSNKRSNAIGVICNDLSNPYYGEVLCGIEEAASANNYNVMISSARSNIKKNLNELLARKADGIILMVFPYKFDYDYNIFDDDIKIVLTHNVQIKDGRFSHLEPDFAGGIGKLLDHLKDMGKSEIVMLSAFSSEMVFDNRLSAFIEGYEKRFNKKARYIVNKESHDTTLLSGKQITKQFLESGMSAEVLFYTNDLMAMGGMAYLQQHGIRVPDDISIVGIDNVEYCEIVSPTLSSIDYDKKQYGKRLFKMLYSDIQGNQPKSELFPLSVVLRKSVKGK